MNTSLMWGHVSSDLQDMTEKLCISGEAHSRDQVEGSSSGSVLHMGTVARSFG